MSAFPGPFNAVVYAQFNLQGRWKKLLTYTMVYAMLIGGAIWLSSENENPGRHIESIKGWIVGLVALQVLDLMLFGAFRVESAVRGEITSRMIESHRLMPASPLGSILGYLFGAPLQAYLIAITNFLLGLACCLIAGVSTDAWAIVNGTLFCFALFLYSIITQHALLARGAFVILIILAVVLISGANNSGGLQLFSSLAVLFTPLLGRASVFDQLFNSSRVTPDAAFAFICSLSAQAIIAAICIRIAIRRYLTANAIGISPALGLMLLATWVGLALTYFLSPEAFRYWGRYGDSVASSDQVVSTLISCFLVSLLPISSAAKTVWVRRRTGNDPQMTGKSSIAGTASIAGAIICPLLIFNPQLRGDMIVHTYQTVLILLFFLIGITCIFCWGYQALNRAWVFAVIWLAITWAGPLIVSAVHQAMTDDTKIEETVLPAFSPGGAISMVWSNSTINPMPGIIGQGLLTLLPIALLLLARAKQQKRTARKGMSS